MHDHRMVARTSFRSVDFSDRFWLGGIRTKPINRLSRKRHQLAVHQGPRGLIKRCLRGSHG